MQAVQEIVEIRLCGLSLRSGSGGWRPAKPL